MRAAPLGHPPRSSRRRADAAGRIGRGIPARRRRRPRRRRREPAAAPLPRARRHRPNASCIVVTRRLERASLAARRVAGEPAAPRRTRRDRRRAARPRCHPHPRFAVPRRRLRRGRRADLGGLGRCTVRDRRARPPAPTGPPAPSSAASRTRRATCLQRVAIAGTTFDTDEFVALSGVSDDAAYRTPRRRARSRRHRARRRRATASATRSSATRCSPTCRRTGNGRSIATRPNGSTRSARHPRASVTTCSHAGDPAAVPYLIRRAETEAALGAYRDALALVEAARPYARARRHRASLRAPRRLCSSRSVTRRRSAPIRTPPSSPTAPTAD